MRVRTESCSAEALNPAELSLSLLAAGASVSNFMKQGKNRSSSRPPPKTCSTRFLACSRAWTRSCRSFAVRALNPKLLRNQLRVRPLPPIHPHRLVSCREEHGGRSWDRFRVAFCAGALIVSTCGFLCGQTKRVRRCRDVLCRYRDLGPSLRYL